MPTENAPLKQPPLLTLYQLGTGHYFSRALHLAAKLGIAELLAEGPRNSQELAEATATHAPSLQRVMRLLASVGVFDEREDGAFALTPVGEALRAGVPGSARAMVMLFTGERVQNAWGELEYCVRTGEPVFRKRGLDDPFKDPERTPEESANFDAAMADVTRLTSIAVAAAYDFRGRPEAVRQVPVAAPRLNDGDLLLEDGRHQRVDHPAGGGQAHREVSPPGFNHHPGERGVERGLVEGSPVVLAPEHAR